MLVWCHIFHINTGVRRKIQEDEIKCVKPWALCLTHVRSINVAIQNNKRFSFVFNAPGFRLRLKPGITFWTDKPSPFLEMAHIN